MLADRNAKRAGRLAALMILVGAVMMAMAPLAAQAETYFVFGRVYSASPLPEAEGVPENPLIDVDLNQVIGGERLFAQVPRNLVQVRVIATRDGSELGTHITRHDGGYYVSFSAAPDPLDPDTNPSGTGIGVRIVVEELATSKTLLDRDNHKLLTAGAGSPNILYLLIDEGLSEIDSDRDFATADDPTKHTGIFTRVGKVEVNYIGDTTGLINIPSGVSQDLAIPEYQDAPFGGNLYVFGAFSQYLYSPMPPDASRIYYKVKVENTDTTAIGYVTDKLVKTLYTVNFATGGVDSERVTLGPNDGEGYVDPAQCTVGAQPVCYRLTPLSAGPNEFWSFPDLLVLWRTGGRDGTYDLDMEQVGLDDPGDYDPVDYTSIKIHLDNKSPLARILPLGPDDEGAATPRVYTPSPPDAGIGGDLGDTLLGTFPDHYGGTGDKRCDIFNLQGDVGSKYLAFKLKAHHENGFMRYWYFSYRRNDGGYHRHIGKFYNGTGMVDLTDVQVSSSQSDVHGFEDKYLYLNKDYLAGGVTTPPSCGYRFVIRAATRATDGYHYLRYSSGEDIHYLQR